MSDLHTQSGQDSLLPTTAQNSTVKDADVDTDSIKSAETESTKYTEKKSKNCASQKIMGKMYKLMKEIGVMLLFAFTYAAFTNNPPKVSKSPPAFPFFPKNSIVIDWYRGELSDAIEQASESDVAFVMYYAPWDAESQLIRHEFEKAALHLYKQVTFAAINCWHPGSECRAQYNQVFAWPVLMAYPAHSRGVQYRGPRTAPHMIRFLQVVAKPLTRVSDSAQLNALLANHEAVVVGTVNALHGSADYGILYSLAVRFLDRDPLTEVAFAVRTETPKDVYGDNTSPILTLHLWNETLIYPSDQDWKSEMMMMWVSDNLHQVSLWASLPGSKSRTLSPYLQPGPTLILFTPQNPLHGFNDYYDLLREVGLQYYNCDKKPWIQNQIDLIRNKRIDNYNKYYKQLAKCNIKKATAKNQSFPTVVTYNLPTTWINNSCCLSKKQKNICLPCPESQLVDKLLSDEEEECQNSKESCADVIKNYHPLRIDEASYKSCKDGNVQEKNEYSSKISMFNGYNDNQSPKRLLKREEDIDCHNFKLAYRLQTALFTDINKNDVYDAKDPDEINVNGWSCETNASLGLIAMDSTLYHHFAEGFGIDIQSKKDKTAVVIVYDETETHYVMPEPYDRTNLKNFIKNFTTNTLTRALSSTAVLRHYTHFYRHKTSCKANGSVFCINELSSNTFLPAVLKRNTAVVVLYYSMQCSFCSGISYNLLNVAKQLINIPALKFYRIDGDKNSLPWAYTMDQFPTILFFPAKRKSESRVFPRNMPITVVNVINFILVNVEPNMKLHAMWALCNQTRFADDKQICLKHLRTESLELTNVMLREWRNAARRLKQKILHRLQNIRKISLLLAHNPQDASTIERHMNKLYHHDSSNVFVPRDEL